MCVRLFGDYSGVISEVFWEHFGKIWIYFFDLFGFFFLILWEILGTLFEILGKFWEKSGHNLGKPDKTRKTYKNQENVQKPRFFTI